MMANPVDSRSANSSSSSALEEDEANDEFARVNRVMLPKRSEEYRQRRERNNAAVKKSRFKSKQKTMETQMRVDELRRENSKLERRVETLTKELNFMRSLFVPRREVAGALKMIETSQQQLIQQQQQQHQTQSQFDPQSNHQHLS